MEFWGEGQGVVSNLNKLGYNVEAWPPGGKRQPLNPLTAPLPSKEEATFFPWRFKLAEMCRLPHSWLTRRRYLWGGGTERREGAGWNIGCCIQNQPHESAGFGFESCHNYEWLKQAIVYHTVKTPITVSSLDLSAEGESIEGFSSCCRKTTISASYWAKGKHLVVTWNKFK